MSGGINLSLEELHGLFSIVMCLDESLTIVHASPILSKHVTGLDDKPALNDIFEVIRPSGIETFSDACSNINSLYLMTAKNDPFAIRGQLLRTRFEDREVLYFCGAPWLFWIHSNHPETWMELTDFSIQDVQLDQLFFMSTEKRMVADLEQLNRDLNKAREEAEAAQESKNRTFARMSHEMRTPLNSMISALSLLQYNELSGKNAELISLTRSASNNLMQVINYVLDVSKLDAIDTISEATEFSEQELLQSVVELIRPRAVEKSLAVTVDNDPNLSQSYVGDMLRLRQTLLNLAINAIKFTESGSVTLRTRLAARSSKQHIVRFEVTDTGIGISPEDQEKVFQPFWSVQAHRQRASDQGTGLGLDIVRKNIELMEGKIGLQSTPGKGSTFWLEVPLVPVTGTLAAANEDPAISQDPELSRLSGNVLLVDDNETNLMLGSMILESLGVTVTPASGGAMAVAAAKENGFDLVLMDLNMPDIDGVEATHQIRGFADKNELPIIALTAYADARETSQCVDVGMNGYLTKPIIREELARELAEWLPVASEQDIPHPPGDMIGPRSDACNQEDLVNTSVLIDLRKEIGPDNLGLVLDKFRSESELRWAELESAYSEDNSDSIMRLIHTLVSTFRSLGLLTAGDSLAAIESQYRSHNPPDPSWLEEVAQLKDNSLAALEQVICRL